MNKCIKERPINIKDYYRDLKADYKAKIEDANKSTEIAIQKNIEFRAKIEEHKNNYKRDYKINLDSYPEYVQEQYIDGKFLNDVSDFYRNCKYNEDVRHAILLVKYATNLKTISDNKKKLIVYNKIVELKYEEFKRYIKTFYMEVQRQMIVNGYGYKLHGRIGTVCINRCKINVPKTLVDTKLTKRNIEKLRSEGKEIYDEKKAKYYAEHGLEYKGVNPRIYRTDQFCYEFCLLWTNMKHGFYYKFEPYDYWSQENRGKTKEDFIKEANGNLAYICGLDITFRTKVTICNEIDKTLYLKFIRNENQSHITTSKSYR